MTKCRFVEVGKKEKIENGEPLTREDIVDWHKSLSAKGWMGFNWPVEYGGTGWSPAQIYIFQNELGLAGCPPLIPFGVSMVGPVIYTFGNQEQKDRLWNNQKVISKLYLRKKQE